MARSASMKAMSSRSRSRVAATARRRAQRHPAEFGRLRHLFGQRFTDGYLQWLVAFGVAGDVLLVLSAHGNCANVLAAIEAAHEREMTVVALTGKGGGKITHALRETDVHVCVPNDHVPRIQEVHLLVLHCICDAVDAQLLGDQEVSS